jgi:hypothetical protein
MNSTKQDSAIPLDGNQPEAVAVSKRALLKAAWVAPVIVALSLPRSSFAANISGSHRETKGGSQEPKGNNGNHFGQFKKGG